jgi:2'-5' RNA ligase
MRLFVALMPPPEAIEDLDAFLEPRRRGRGSRSTGSGSART